MRAMPHMWDCRCVDGLKGGCDMARGRKPLPTALKILKATRAYRINWLEPDAPKGTPAMPDWLAGEAAAEWSRIVPMIQALGVLSTSDGPALAVYCQAHAEARQAEALIARD